MSTSTVPIFDPSGIARDIPYEQMKDAIAAGGKPGVLMQSPDGKTRVIPAGVMQDAVKAGGKVIPFDQQLATDHPGFWSSVVEDAFSIPKGIIASLPPVQAYHAIVHGKEEYDSLTQTGKTTEQISDAERKQAGYSVPYRALAPGAANAVGVNLPAMEHSAEIGDESGVWGHTVVPAATAAAPIAGEAAGRTAGAVVNSRVGKSGVVLAKGGAKLADVAAFERLSKAVKTVKDTAGKLKDIWTPPEVAPSVPPAVAAPAPVPPIAAPRSLKPGAYEAPASPLRPPKQLGSGVIEGEYVDEPPVPSKPAIANLPAGIYEQRGGFEPNQPALRAKPAIPLPERFAQARAELGPDAPLSKVVDRAQQLRIGTTDEPARVPSGESIPRTLSGGSALRQVLTGQDNANLLKIAKSRGLNVTRESQLRPGFADNLLINKIINDFSDDELSNVRDTFLESKRFRHDFGDVGAEARKTMSLQTYFPELKLTAAQLKRTESAIAAGKKPPVSADEDLVDLLKQSVEDVKKKRR